jgi:sulfatase maturation enzyme AslB (radical SAM superfamily)
MAFTNGTLVDDAFAKALVDVGNFGLAFSIEGFEDATDFRRGKGTYEKVIQGMQNMKKYGAPFGFSACYHSKNTEALGNEAFLDFLIEQGCMFGWYFTYIPLGKDADTSLLATPEQREYMFHWVRKMRDIKPIYILDFWNDGQYVNGCVAGGRATSILMQQGMWSRARSSIILTPTFGIPPCWMRCDRPSSGSMRPASRLIQITSGPAPSWTIQKLWRRW